jgi:hypothetical protein
MHHLVLRFSAMPAFAGAALRSAPGHHLVLSAAWLSGRSIFILF